MVILPPATIGILGGGQLGRMTALAARAMGYRVQVLDPDPDCAARPVVDRVVAAAFDDPGGAAALARSCDVVTLEIEQIGVEALAAAKRHAPVRPDASVLAIIQDRAAQKKWLRERHHPIGEYHDVEQAEDIVKAVTELGERVRGIVAGREAELAASVIAPLAGLHEQGRSDG